MIILIQIIAVLLIAYVALGLTLFFTQSSLLYRPMREIPYKPDEIGLEFEDIYLTTSDGIRINAWFIPAQNTRITILFCHGNGGNIMHRLDSINIFNELRMNCLIFDYRGYGNSEGIPTEEGTYLDAQASYDWLIKEKKILPENIIIFGRSLGASIAAQLASKVKPKALVAESPFTSYVDVCKKFYPYMPVKWFARFKYETIKDIKKVQCPVMVIHSQNDDLIPFEFGQEVFDAANEPKKFLEIFGGHNDSFLVSSEVYKTGWKDWLKFLQNQDTLSQQQNAS